MMTHNLRRPPRNNSSSGNSGNSSGGGEGGGGYRGGVAVPSSTTTSTTTTADSIGRSSSSIHQQLTQPFLQLPPTSSPATLGLSSLFEASSSTPQPDTGGEVVLNHCNDEDVTVPDWQSWAVEDLVQLIGPKTSEKHKKPQWTSQVFNTSFGTICNRIYRKVIEEQLLTFDQEVHNVHFQGMKVWSSKVKENKLQADLLKKILTEDEEKWKMFKTNIVAGVFEEALKEEYKPASSRKSLPSGKMNIHMQARILHMVADPTA